MQPSRSRKPLPGAFYHDFSRLGLKCEQLEGIYARNQSAKEPIITAYILFAIAKLRNSGVAEVSLAELFCADAYYALFARKFVRGADRVAAFDNDCDGFLAYAAVARGLLELDGVDLHKMDVHDIPESWRYSIVLNTGGLYHVTDPVEVLQKSFRLAQRYLIVQSVVSLTTNDASYIETPAPGWSWGCRFSRSYLEKVIYNLDYDVVDCEFNELSGNARLEDRGSLYFLIDTERPKRKAFTVPADLGAGADHYRAYVGPPQQYDLIGAAQFRLLTALGLRQHHRVLDFGCGSLRAGRLLIPYLDPGNYFGIEPRQSLIDDAFQFELGKNIRAIKRPTFSHNDDFRIPFPVGCFDYILVQSIFTHAGWDITQRLLSEIQRTLAPQGVAAVTFLQVDRVEEDTETDGWTYPACVGYTVEKIRSLALAAGLEARRLAWYTPRVTWFLLSRVGEQCIPDGHLGLLRGPVLKDPAFAATVPPDEGLLIADPAGAGQIILGRRYELSSSGAGFVDVIEVHARVLAVHGWAVDRASGSEALWVACAYKGKLLQPLSYVPVLRGDVCEHLNLPADVAAGFFAEFCVEESLESLDDVVVVAALPSGTVLPLPRSG